MAFQPETVYRIFQRAMSGLDIATGIVRSSQNNRPLYKTVGPKVVRNATVLPPLLEMECYTLEALNTCTPEQTTALANGTAVIQDYVMIQPGPGS